MLRKNLQKSSNGFSMIEVLVSISISALILMVFVELMVYSRRVSRHNGEQLKGIFYAREAAEIAKDLEVSNWTEINKTLCLDPLPCHPEKSGSAWIMATGEESLDGGKYTRKVSTHPVYRDTLAYPNQIVETPGVLDPDTKKVSTEVSWNGEFGTKNARLETYVYKNP